MPFPENARMAARVEAIIREEGATPATIAVVDGRLKIGQKVGVGWSASSCLSCPQCVSGSHNLCATTQGTIVGRHGGFANRLRVQWVWARPLPEGIDVAKTGPLLCGGITVFTPIRPNAPPGLPPTSL